MELVEELQRLFSDEYLLRDKSADLRWFKEHFAVRIITTIKAQATELTLARAEIARKDEALRRVLEWWPEGSETGRQDKGGSFAADIRNARAALKDTTP